MSPASQTSLFSEAGYRTRTGDIQLGKVSLYHETPKFSVVSRPPLGLTRRLPALGGVRPGVEPGDRPSAPEADAGSRAARGKRAGSKAAGHAGTTRGRRSP